MEIEVALLGAELLKNPTQENILKTIEKVMSLAFKEGFDQGTTFGKAIVSELSL